MVDNLSYPYFTGRPVNASRPVKYGSTRKYTGRPAKIRSTRIIRVDPSKYGSTRIFMGGPAKLRVDPYLKYGSNIEFTGRPVFLKYGSTRIGAFDPLGTP